LWTCCINPGVLRFEILGEFRSNERFRAAVVLTALWSGVLGAQVVKGTNELSLALVGLETDPDLELRMRA
jgi:hypothetical protein